MSTTPPSSTTSAPRTADAARTEKPTTMSPSELRALAARPSGAPAKPPSTSFRALLEGTRGTKDEAHGPIEKRAPGGDREAEVDPDGPKRPRPLAPRRDEESAPGLEAFRPPSAILAPAAAAAPRTAGSGLDRAEAAALAERLVTSLRVGRVGADGHVVQLRIRGAGADLEVRVRHEHGRLGIVLAARDARGLEEAGRISRALAGELESRGLALDAIEVEDAR